MQLVCRSAVSLAPAPELPSVVEGITERSRGTAVAEREGYLGRCAALAHLVGHNADGRASRLHHGHFYELPTEIHCHEWTSMNCKGLRKDFVTLKHQLFSH